MTWRELGTNIESRNKEIQAYYDAGYPIGWQSYKGTTRYWYPDSIIRNVLYFGSWLDLAIPAVETKRLTIKSNSVLYKYIQQGYNILDAGFDGQPLPIEANSLLVASDSISPGSVVFQKVMRDGKVIDHPVGWVKLSKEGDISVVKENISDEAVESYSYDSKLEVRCYRSYGKIDQDLTFPSMHHLNNERGLASSSQDISSEIMSKVQDGRYFGEEPKGKIVEWRGVKAYAITDGTRVLVFTIAGYPVGNSRNAEALYLGDTSHDDPALQGEWADLPWIRTHDINESSLATMLPELIERPPGGKIEVKGKSFRIYGNVTTSNGELIDLSVVGLDSVDYSALLNISLQTAKGSLSPGIKNKIVGDLNQPLESKTVEIDLGRLAITEPAPMIYLSSLVDPVVEIVVYYMGKYSHYVYDVIFDLYYSRVGRGPPAEDMIPINNVLVKGYGGLMTEILYHIETLMK